MILLVKIGQGAFGAVYLATQDGVREVAVKCSTINLTSGPSHNRFWKEIETIASCRDK